MIFKKDPLKYCERYRKYRCCHVDGILCNVDNCDMKTIKTLYLPILKKHFDDILQGKKKYEYREYKKHWIERLENKHFDEILFRNGYSKSSRMIRTECLGIYTTTEPTVLNTKKTFVIKIGRILEVNMNGK